MRTVSLMICIVACSATATGKIAAQASPTASPQSGACVVSIENKVAVTDASRSACVAIAHLIEPLVPEISNEALAAGPPSFPQLDESQDVYCRFKPSAKSGQSLKFRCLRTDAENHLYDDAGQIVPEATSFDAQNVLLDASRKRLLTPDGKPRHGDQLRVKYFLGEFPAERYREMFSETVVSRLFWALGIPVDRVYLPASVRCFGCSTSPFGQTASLTGAVPQVFRLASVERRYEGKAISVPRRSGVLGSGPLYDFGFSFTEVPHKLELEVLALAMNIVGYYNFASFQNRLICRSGHWDTNSGTCDDVVAYVQDVGGSLGGPVAYHVRGKSTPTRTVHPRADLITFFHGRVFRDPKSCVLYYDVGGVRQVSEAARLMMAARIKGRLGRGQLHVIFEKAKIQHLDQRANELAAEMYNLKPGPDLDQAVQNLWAEEMDKRLNEVLNRKCS